MLPRSRHHQQALENRQFCTAEFLDVSQTFDKVWHPGLLLKIKKILPIKYYNLLKSYLQERHYVTKYNNETSRSFQIHSGVPQGSILGPLLSYCTHQTYRHPGAQRWAHSPTTQPYLQPMLTPRQPHEIFRNTSSPYRIGYKNGK